MESISAEETDFRGRRSHAGQSARAPLPLPPERGFEATRGEKPSPSDRESQGKQNLNLGSLRDPQKTTLE